MFLTDLLNLWKKDTLLGEASQACEEMLKLGHQMFQYSLRVLLDDDKEVKDIYAMDRQMNRLEIAVRRKVVEHLTVNPTHDPVAMLFMASIVGDIERIGDYCKNLIELAHHYPEKLAGSYIDRIREIEQEVSKMYEMTVRAFGAGDAELARTVMGMHAQLARDCEFLIDKLLAETDMPGREAVIRALLVRFLKRVAAHLKNVSSSLVNPYHMLGYKPDGSPDDADE